MKHLLIIGARGFGREIYNLAINSIGYQEEFDIKGYLDNKLDALCDYKNYPPIIDSVEVLSATRRRCIYLCLRRCEL